MDHREAKPTRQRRGDDVPLLRIVDERIGNLPLPLSSFVGREDDISALAEEVMSAGLVTLTGPAGVGKTRLALKVAEEVRDQFPDGAWFCELAPVGDSRTVGHAVAAALGLPLQQGMTAVESVVDILRGSRMLVVLDNCEHLLGAVLDLVQAITSGAATVTILATSREPLGLQGECVSPVRSLDAVTEGAELFHSRAESADSTFAATVRLRPIVADICRRLDGNPLAIELAAARTRSMSVHEISARLGDRLRLLQRPERDEPERHQTLRAAVQWSHDLLSEVEKALFGRLSVFTGRFDFAAAEAVCSDANMVHAADVVDLLTSLVEKSMLQADRSGEVTSFTLLEAFRQFGEERLIDRDELRYRQGVHLRTYAERIATHQRSFESENWSAAMEAYEFDWDQIRTAAGWATANEDAKSFCDLIPRLHFFSVLTARYEVGEWLRRADETMELNADAYSLYAWMASFQGEHAESERLGLEGVRAGLQSGGDPGAGLLWYVIKNVRARMGDTDGEAEATDELRKANEHDPSPFRAALVGSGGIYPGASPAQAAAIVKNIVQISAGLRNEPLQAVVHFNIGIGFLRAKRYEDAELQLKQGVEFARASGAVHVEGGVLSALAAAYAAQGRAEAGSAFQAAIRRAWENRDWRTIAQALSSYARWLARNNREQESAVVFGFLVEHEVFTEAELPALVHSLRGDPALTDSFVRGAVFTRDKVVSFALAIPSESEVLDAAATNDTPLSPRELEVLGLLATGASNREIAAQLHIALPTVATHIGHILDKLDVSNRTEATAYAVSEGLIPHPRDIEDTPAP